MTRRELGDLAIKSFRRKPGRNGENDDQACGGKTSRYREGHGKDAQRRPQEVGTRDQTEIGRQAGGLARSTPLRNFRPLRTLLRYCRAQRWDVSPQVLLP